MRFFVLLIAISLALFPGCKVRHKVVKQATTETLAPKGNSEGKVSHMYRQTGCATVVIVKKEGQEDITLIPKDTLAKEFDIDGLEIYFNYHLLKMKNPAGCNAGIPAQLTDISKK